MTSVVSAPVYFSIPSSCLLSKSGNHDIYCLFELNKSKVTIELGSTETQSKFIEYMPDCLEDKCIDHDQYEFDEEDSLVVEVHYEGLEYALHVQFCEL